MTLQATESDLKPCPFASCDWLLVASYAELSSTLCLTRVHRGVRSSAAQDALQSLGRTSSDNALLLVQPLARCNRAFVRRGSARNALSPCGRRSRSQDV